MTTPIGHIANVARAKLDAANKANKETAAIYRACGYTLAKLTRHESPTRRLTNALRKAMPDMVFSMDVPRSAFLDPTIHVWGGPIKYENRLSIYLHSKNNGESVNPIQYAVDHCEKMAASIDESIKANDSADIERLAEIEAQVKCLMIEAEDIAGGYNGYDVRKAFPALWPERR